LATAREEWSTGVVIPVGESGKSAASLASSQETWDLPKFVLRAWSAEVIAEKGARRKKNRVEGECAGRKQIDRARKTRRDQCLGAATRLAAIRLPPNAAL